MIFGFAGICHNRSTCTLSTYAIVASYVYFGAWAVAYSRVRDVYSTVRYASIVRCRMLLVLFLVSDFEGLHAYRPEASADSKSPPPVPQRNGTGLDGTERNWTELDGTGRDRVGRTGLDAHPWRTIFIKS